LQISGSIIISLHARRMQRDSNHSLVCSTGIPSALCTACGRSTADTHRAFAALVHRMRLDGMHCELNCVLFKSRKWRSTTVVAPPRPAACPARPPIETCTDAASAPSVSSTCPSHALAPFIILIFAQSFLFSFSFVCVLLTGGGNGDVRGHLHTDGVGDTRGTRVRAMPKCMSWPSECSSVIEVWSSW